MGLDGVHFEAISSLLGAVDRPGRDRDRRELAERVWAEAFQSPPNDLPIDPVGEVRRDRAPVGDLAVTDAGYDRVTAVDAGSMNPTTFRNGLVVDVAHAAMATTPSAVDRHRRRTIVGTAHGPPTEVRSTDGWTTFDDGFGRSRLVAAPQLDRGEDTAVHSLALETAELAHAQTYRDPDDDLLLMDGSVYPSGVLHWADRGGELAHSLGVDDAPRAVLQRAVDLVDGCTADDVALAGVVKNWSGRRLVRAIADAEALSLGTLPWPTDATLFQQLLADPDGPARSLAWTSWFTMDAWVGSALAFTIEEYGLDADAPATHYDLGFMVVYDPRENVTFRVEAPGPFIRDDASRRRLTDHVLAGIARERGPPSTIAKADALARIGHGERRQLRRELAALLDSTEVRRYDAVRWPGEDGEPSTPG